MRFGIVVAVALAIASGSAAQAGYVNDPAWASNTFSPGSTGSNNASTPPVLSNGNLTVQLTNPLISADWTWAYSTKPVTAGDNFYAEFTINSLSPSNSSSSTLQFGFINWGVSTANQRVNTNLYCGGFTNLGYSTSTAGQFQSFASTSDGHDCVAGDVIMMAANPTTGNVWFGYNGVWIGGGNPATGTSPTYNSIDFAGGLSIAVQVETGSSASVTANFGATAYDYSDPFPVYVPEPASALLVLGGLASWGRRRLFPKAGLCGGEEREKRMRYLW